MIQIKKSNTADTRTCDWSKVTKEQLQVSSEQHIDDVRKGLAFFCERLKDAAAMHDFTKIKNIDEFYRDFQTGFKTTEWWQMHQREERHHMKDPQYVQSDVNLIDVLEMITDCVMAGMARSGEYRHEEIPDSLLREAFNNTVKLLLKNVEVLK